MPTVVHFEIPADNTERAKKFYSELFGWQFSKWEGPMEYWLVATKKGSGGEGVSGGLTKRQSPEQRPLNYIDVPSVDEYMAKVNKLGGKVIFPKTAVPGMGYLAICLDTENNAFGIWEENKNAK